MFFETTLLPSRTFGITLILLLVACGRSLRTFAREDAVRIRDMKHHLKTLSNTLVGGNLINEFVGSEPQSTSEPTIGLAPEATVDAALKPNGKSTPFPALNDTANASSDFGGSISVGMAQFQWYYDQWQRGNVLVHGTSMEEALLEWMDTPDGDIGYLGDDMKKAKFKAGDVPMLFEKVGMGGQTILRCLRGDHAGTFLKFVGDGIPVQFVSDAGSATKFEIESSGGVYSGIKRKLNMMGNGIYAGKKDLTLTTSSKEAQSYYELMWKPVGYVGSQSWSSVSTSFLIPTENASQMNKKWGIPSSAPQELWAGSAYVWLDLADAVCHGAVGATRDIYAPRQESMDKALEWINSKEPLAKRDDWVYFHPSATENSAQPASAASIQKMLLWPRDQLNEIYLAKVPRRSIRGVIATNEENLRVLRALMEQNASMIAMLEHPFALLPFTKDKGGSQWSSGAPEVKHLYVPGASPGMGTWIP
jgi:hypothetical protein